MSPSSSSSRPTPPHSSLDENQQERVVRASRTRRSGRPANIGPRSARRTRSGALTVQAPTHQRTETFRQPDRRITQDHSCFQQNQEIESLKLDKESCGNVLRDCRREIESYKEIIKNMEEEKKVLSGLKIRYANEISMLNSSLDYNLSRIRQNLLSYQMHPNRTEIDRIISTYLPRAFNLTREVEEAQTNLRNDNEVINLRRRGYVG